MLYLLHDGISNKIVKLLKNEISKPLTVIVNQMLKTGIFPDSFKTSEIVPLFKKGDHGLLNNYRPISLIPTISKVFERVIYDQMYLYFNNNNLLADEQFGFRKNHSTEYAAIKLVDHISNEKWNLEKHPLLCSLTSQRRLIRCHLIFCCRS